MASNQFQLHKHGGRAQNILNQVTSTKLNLDDYIIQVRPSGQSGRGSALSKDQLSAKSCSEMWNQDSPGVRYGKFQAFVQ